MKERSIIFNAHDVRAILDGRKTQTRRIVKLRYGADVIVTNGQVWKPARVDYEGYVDCPFGQSGDRLWVRETWMHSNWPDGPAEPDCAVFYRADYLDDPLGPDLEHSPDSIRRKWLPSIHMPRWASRILLEVTAVRVQRLQDISENEAIAEGVEPVIIGEGWRHYCKDWRDELVGIPPCSTARESFEKLWQSAHSPDSWDQNPWVWVIEFRRVEP